MAAVQQHRPPVQQPNVAAERAQDEHGRQARRQRREHEQHGNGQVEPQRHRLDAAHVHAGVAHHEQRQHHAQHLAHFARRRMHEGKVQQVCRHEEAAHQQVRHERVRPERENGPRGPGEQHEHALGAPQVEQQAQRRQAQYDEAGAEAPRFHVVERLCLRERALDASVKRERPHRRHEHDARPAPSKEQVEHHQGPEHLTPPLPRSRSADVVQSMIGPSARSA